MTDTQKILEENKNLKEKILRLQQENDFFREKFKLAQHKQFGVSSEKSPDQLDWLFNEAETIEDVALTEKETALATDDTEVTAQVSTKKKSGRKPLPKDLPRETRIIDVAAADKVCPCCNGDLHRIGEEKSEQLEYIPASLKVIETLRPKYACRQCEKNNSTTPIIIAPVPASPIPKSMATPSLLAHIISNKYQFALPLYRQEMVFQQLNIDLNRKTLSNWMMRSAAVLESLLLRLKTKQLAQQVLHADETPVIVIADENQKSYMWVYCSGGDSPDPNSTLKNCMAHVRRKFIEAQKVQVKGKVGRADWAVAHIQKLYRVEAQLAGKTFEEKYTLRQQYTVSLLTEFKTWLDKSAQQVAPKTTLGMAVAYTLRQWGKLTTYTQHGQLSIDNNRAERAIKPFVIGRKNWLFSNTASGAKASAILYSVIETAKANGLNPVKYVELLLTEIPRRNSGDDLENLMPWVVKLGVDD